MSGRRCSVSPLIVLTGASVKMRPATRSGVLIVIVAFNAVAHLVDKLRHRLAEGRVHADVAVGGDPEEHVVAIVEHVLVDDVGVGLKSRHRGVDVDGHIAEQDLDELLVRVAGVTGDVGDGLRRGDGARGLAALDDEACPSRRRPARLAQRPSARRATHRFGSASRRPPPAAVAYSPPGVGPSQALGSGHLSGSFLQPIRPSA